MNLVKLGGSLITAKRTRKGTGKLPQKIFLRNNVVQVSKELKAGGTKLILVHGAGSFGHVKAKKYGLHESYDPASAQKRKGAAEVSRDVRELNLNVMEVLSESSLNCISVPPAVTIENSGGKLHSFETGSFEHYLNQGLIPVSFGDLVHDTRRGISICSGDDIMLELAIIFSPERAVFVTDVDGVFIKNPFAHDNAELIKRMTPKQFKNLGREVEKGGVDVTGGMYRKAELCLEIARTGTECIIMNGLVKGRLRDVLKGKRVVGTYF